MSITIKKAVTINNDTDWLKVAPPKGKDRQWKDGYSAKELAKYVTANSKDFDILIKAIVQEQFGKKCSTQFIGEPEADTKLYPKGSSGPRNHDLLLYNDDVVIGIEAKVNEPFGETVQQKYEKNETGGIRERIKQLIENITPDREYKDICNLRYQLFTATAGTMLEACNKKVDKCIFLILSFYVDEMGRNTANDESFEEFVKVVGDKKMFRIKDLDGNEHEIDCRIVKKDIRIARTSYEVK